MLASNRPYSTSGLRQVKVIPLFITVRSPDRCIDITEPKYTLIGTYWQEVASAAQVHREFHNIRISSESVKDHFNIMIANQRALMKAPQYRNDPSKLVFMRIQPDIATLIYKLDPQFAQFRAHDGSLVVELGQALYGCIQSALHWHTLGFFAFFAP